MAKVEAEVVYTRDLSSGRVHTRYRVEGSSALATREGCNVDQAGAYELVDADFVAATNPALLCDNDFPDGPASLPSSAPSPAADPESDDGSVETDEEIGGEG